MKNKFEKNLHEKNVILVEKSVKHKFGKRLFGIFFINFPKIQMKILGHGFLLSLI